MAIRGPELVVFTKLVVHHYLALTWRQLSQKEVNAHGLLLSTTLCLSLSACCPCRSEPRVAQPVLPRFLAVQESDLAHNMEFVGDVGRSHHLVELR